MLIMNGYLRSRSLAVMCFMSAAIGCQNEAPDKTKVLTKEIAELRDHIKQLETKIDELKSAPERPQQTESVGTAPYPAREPEFDATSLELTGRWSSFLLERLESARASANEIKLTDTRKIIDELRHGTIGQFVNWKLTVSSVTEQHVYLQQLALSSSVLVVWAFKGESSGEQNGVRLQVGDQISREQAAGSSKGDLVTIHGCVDKVQITTPSRPRIRFELDDVTGVASR
jgi:hypothetical protein